MRKIFSLAVFVVAALALTPVSAQTSATSGLQVVLAGTFQSLLGGSNWTPSSDAGRMSERSPGVYEFVAKLPQGAYQYKVAIGGAWTESYGKNSAAGGANIDLVTPQNDTVVKFVFDAKSHTIQDSINNPAQVKAPATAPATAAAKPAPSATTAASGDGATTLVLHYRRLKGDYDGWNVWGWAHQPKSLDGAAYAFTGQDDFGKVATITIPGQHSEMGFILRQGEWVAKDMGDDRFATVKPGAKSEIWVLQGIKEFSTSLQDATKNVAPPKLPAFLDASDRIRASIFSPVVIGSTRVSVTVGGQAVAVKKVEDASSPAPVAGQDVTDPTKVVVAGTVQAALGGAEWNPNGDISRMAEVTPGVFELIVALPAGSFEYKVARGGSWKENWGADGVADGPNIALNVPAPQVVRIVFEATRHMVLDSINNAAQVKAPAVAPARPAAPAPVAKAANAPTSLLDVTLAAPISPEQVNQPIQLLIGDQNPMTVYAREALSDRAYWYSGNDLGARYTLPATTFKVWSPVSSTVELIVFDASSGAPRDTYDMTRGPAGVWTVTVKGNLNGKYYQYRFNSYGQPRLAADINGFAASRDGTRSMVVDLSKTNPSGWTAQRTPQLAAPTDAIIYEMHVRDFTVDPSSGVKPEWRGAYLGLTERGTIDPNTKAPTGLDYLVKLGVTDAHLMPFQKFNPANATPYNWGYETALFNTPDPRYSTQPDNPAFTVSEVKQMVQALHAAGIRVIMDVVYNHTVPISGDASAFDSTVPYYYFRTNDEGQLINESGVGNAMNDERPMARKFIRDSLTYWVREYKVDGFRFDLLGMFSKPTVQDLQSTLRGIRPDLVLYGEPWTGGGPTRFGKGVQRGVGMAVFNDDYRNALRGDLDGARLGFVMGGTTSAVALQKGLVGEFPYSDLISGFTDSPLETINYISAHDNLALWDKVAKVMPDAAPALQASAVKLSGAGVLLAQGIPFLEGGVEMGRTKGGNNNSYNSGDSVNRFDWDRGARYAEVTTYYAGLIALRKAHPAFRLNNPAQIRSALKFLDATSLPAGTVAFTLDGALAGDAWKSILVVLHGSTASASLNLPAGAWSVAVNGQNAGNSVLGPVNGSLTLDPLSAYVLYK